MDQISADDFASIGNVFQIGVPPRRIDITTVVDGVEFADCYSRSITVEWDDIQLKVISKQDLIINKRASGRPQDLLDAEILEQSEK